MSDTAPALPAPARFADIDTDHSRTVAYVPSSDLDALRKALDDSHTARVEAAAGFAGALTRARVAQRNATRAVVAEIITALSDGDPADAPRRVAVTLLRRAAVLGLDDAQAEQLDPIAEAFTPARAARIGRAFPSRTA
ncbi:hypothetical protein ACIPRL_08150 [Streptomyces sp. NPDC090085]|uniref:hypothetical protein n=1 Tax=Streptomyces sp. NPDC090085 TaxID=3365943 RepID=UPI003812709A